MKPGHGVDVGRSFRCLLVAAKTHHARPLRALPVEDDAVEQLSDWCSLVIELVDL